MPYTIAIDARKILDFGIGTYIRNLIRELANLDSENRYLLLVGTPGRGALDGLPDNFEPVLQRSPTYSARELLAISWQLRRLKVDLYHATHYVLPIFMPCRSVVTIHDIIHLLYPEFLPNRLALLYAERMIRRGLRHANRVITVSHNTRKDLMQHFGVTGRRMEVIHNGVEATFHDILSDEERQRQLASLGLDEPYLLFVGNPKKHKNVDNVVKAYARALELHDFPGQLVCVGDRDGLLAKVRQRAEQMGIFDRLNFVGHVDQELLPAIYQGARLFLYPTLYEGFGLPVVEAMASGVPVITSNTSALKEVGAGYAHLINPLDVEALAKAIVHCLKDDQYRASLRTGGLSRARDFDWRKTAERTLDVYRTVLDKKKRSGS